MYGVVLMAAMTAGQSAPDFHKGSCHGFGGSYGACYGSCHGGNYGACYGACYGMCYGGWNGYAHPSAGCWGAPYSGYGPGWAGYAGYGGCGGYASAAYGVPGPVIATPAPATETLKDPKEQSNPKKSKDDDDDNQVSAGTRARLIVKLPAEGKLFVDDQPIRNAAAQKSFRTPALAKGQRYYYELRAEVVRDGKVVTETRRVELSAGDVIRADFSKLGNSPAISTVNAR